MLCEASATLVKKRGIKLPPAPDVGCYRNAAGDTAVETRERVETVASWKGFFVRKGRFETRMNNIL